MAPGAELESAAVRAPAGMEVPAEGASADLARMEN
jgi:hypothetical protein